MNTTKYGFKNVKLMHSSVLNEVAIRMSKLNSDMMNCRVNDTTYDTNYDAVQLVAF